MGSDILITISLENNINQQLEVSAIGVDFSWDQRISDWGAMSLAPFGSRSETDFIRLPAEPGDYRFDITVHGQAPVQDFFVETCNFSGTFTVLPSPILFLTLVIVVIVAAVVVMAIVLLRRRGKGPWVPPPPSGP